MINTNINNFTISKTPRILALTLLSIAFLVITALVIIPNNTQAHDDGQGQVLGQADIAAVTPSADVVAANNTLNTDLTSYTKATKANKAKALTKLVASAKARKAKMLNEIKTNPAGFLKALIPAATANKLPQEAQVQLEQPIEATGKLTVYHIDYNDQRSDSYSYELEDKNNHKRYNIHLANGAALDKANSEVKVYAVGVDQDLVVAAAGGSSAVGTSLTTVQAAPNYNPIGDQHTLVILVNFTNTVNNYLQNSKTPTIVSNDYFGSTNSVNSLYKEYSYGLTSWSGDVTNWLTIPYDNSNCNTMYETWRNSALQAASSAGFNLSNYGHMVYLLNNPSGCSFGGLSSIGGAPSDSWMAYYSMPIFSHELGHSLGMWHASTINCGSQAIATPLSQCSFSEYGDSYDPMGQTSNYYHFNGPHKAQENWIPASRVQTVTTSGTYTIAPLETASSGIQLLKILKPDSTDVGWGKAYYFVEYRQPIGSDATLPTDMTNGAGIILSPLDVGAPGNTGRIDNTPGDFMTFNNALVDNATFRDAANNITIKQLSHNANGVTVQVTTNGTVDPCVKGTPTFAITPASKTVTVGQSATYQLTVNDNDSTSCPSSIFNTSLTGLPASFSAGNYAAGSLTANPGTVTSGSVSITVPTGTSPGTYNFVVSINNTNDQTQSGAVQGTVVVAGGCTLAAPNVSLSPTSQTGQFLNILNYTVTVKNNDSSACGASTFNANATNLPTGFSTYTPSGTVPLSLNPNGVGTITVPVQSPPDSPNTTANFTIAVSDATAGVTVHNGSAPATYVVSNPTTCVRKAPYIRMDVKNQTYVPGTAMVNFSGLLQNSDPIDCPWSTFTIKAVGLPSGVTTYPVSPYTIKTIAPYSADGALNQTTINFTVGTPTGFPSGTYNFNLVVSDGPHGDTTSETLSLIIPPTGCTRLAPELWIADSSTTTAISGQTVTYHLQLNNKDTAGCPNSNFAIQVVNAPTGFTYNSPTVSAVAPQTVSNPVDFIVTSPLTAKTGQYFLQAQVVDSTVANHNSTTNNVLYNIVNPCIRRAPTLSMDPTSQTGSPGTQASYSVTVTNNDTVDCVGYSTFSFNLTGLPSGYTSDLFPKPNTLIAFPGTSLTAVIYIYSSSSSTTDANFTFNVTDSSMSGHTGSATGTYKINNPPTCTPIAPTITSVNPSSNTGAAGSAQTYTVTLKNNDSSTGCIGSSTFILGTNNLPTGFSRIFNPPSLTLAPQGTGTTTLTVTSPTSAVNGTNNFTISVSDSLVGSTHTASSQATYIVNNPVVCTRLAPTVTISPASLTGKAGDTMLYSYIVKNNDSAACASSTLVAATSNLPSGFTASIGGTILNLAPGASFTAGNLNVSSLSNVSNGTYTFTVGVTDASVGVIHTAAATGTYIVSNPVGCDKSNGVSMTVDDSNGTGYSGQTITVKATVTNKFSAGCGNTTFLVEVSPDNVYTTSTATVTIAPGDTKTVDIAMTSLTNALDNPYIQYMTVKELNTFNVLYSAGFLTHINNNLSTCTRVAPTVTVFPLSQIGAPGQTLNYAVTIKDNDNGSQCTGISQFLIILANLPAGFTKYDPNTATAISLMPGATGTATIGVISPTTATNSTNTFNITTTDYHLTGYAHNSSTPATYIVSNSVSCTRGAPTLSISPSSQTGIAGSNQPYTLTLKNNDSSTGCTNSTFSFPISGLPSGFTSSFNPNPSTLTLIPGATGTASFYVASPSGTANNTYNFTVSAQDSSVGNSHTSNIVSASYIVNNLITCTRAAPTISLNQYSATGKAGDVISYVATVKNNNSVGCDISYYSSNTSGLPAGFASTANPLNLNLSSGQTGTTTINVSSPLLSANQTVNFTITAYDYSNPSYLSGSANATYIVSNIVSCTRSAPTITSVNPTSNTGAAGSAQSYIVTLKNNDSSGCASSTFTPTTASLPSGFTGIFNPTTLTLAPSISNTTTLTVTSPTTAVNGTNNFTISATDSAVGSTHTSLPSSAAYVVSNPSVCTRNNADLSADKISQTGTAGNSFSYVITIKNNDTIACGSTLFAIVPGNLPLGAGGFNANTPQVSIDPGQTGTATLIISTSVLSPDSTYGPVAQLTGNHYQILPLSLKLVPPSGCTRGLVGVSLNPTSQTGLAGSTQTYTVSVKDNDSSLCTSSVYYLFNPILPSGFTGTFGVTELTLAPGDIKTTTFTVTSPSTAANSTNTFTVEADYTSTSLASTTGTYVVGPVVTCTRSTPTITNVNPSSTTGAAGSSQTYIVTLKNNDSTGCTGSSIFTLSTASLPSGFSGTFNPTTLTLAPGQSNTTTLSVVSPLSALNQTVNFTISATDSSVGSAHTSTPASATYVVNNPVVCTRSAPTITSNPTSNTGTAGSTQTYTLTVKNNDSTGCTGTSTFTFSTASLPSGFSGTFNPTSLSLTQGQSGSVTLSVQSPYSATNGTNTFTVNVSDLVVGTTHSASTQASYIVSNPVTCIRGVPTITSVSPSSNTGAAGSTQTYTVTLKNNDSTTGCSGTSTFSLSTASLPSGFSGSFSPSSLTLSPQGSGTSTLYVSSPSSASNQTVYFTISASDSSVGSAHTSTPASATYVVNNPVVCTRGTPLISISPSSQTGNAGSSLSYTVTLKNNDSTTGCTGSSVFSLSSLGLPSGFSGSFSPPSLTLSPQGSGTSTLTVSSPSSTSGNQTIIFYVQAQDSSVGSSHTSNQAQGSYTVQTTTSCSRTKPTLSLSSTTQTVPLSQPIAYYYLAITNNDSPACNFSSRLFYLAASGLPSNYYLNGQGSVAVSVAPGATTNSQPAIIVPYDATNLTINFSIFATDSYGYNSVPATLIIGNGGTTPVCTRGVPTITPSPSSGTGKAGDTLTYTVTVKNTDSTTGCSPTTFSLSAASFPYGFSSSFSPSSLTLSPQGTGQATLSVSSPSYATNNTDIFTITATDSSVGTTHSASTSATYIVNNPIVTCTRGVPTISINPSSGTGQAGTTLSYTLTLINTDSSNCSGTSTFSLSTASLPSGFSSSFSPSSLTLAAGATGTATIYITSPSSASNQTVNFTVSASDSSVGSTHTASTSATYTVNNPVSCTRGVPTISISPSSQTGQAGATLSYTVTLKNNDSTTGCTGSSVFSLSSLGLPSGFSGSFSPSSLTLSPQGTGQATLSVVSPSSATNSTNTFQVSATDSSVGSTHTSVPAQSSYIVSNPTGCSRAIPTITANPATTTITAGSIIYYTLTVTNNDSTGCGLSARTYTVMPFYLNSSFYVNGSASPTLTLNAGASGSVDFPVYSLAFAASGSSTAYFYAFPSDTYTTYSKVPIDITIGSVKGDSTTIPSNQPDNTSSTSPSTSPQPHSPGTLIKIDNTLYIVGNGGLIGIPSMAVLQSWGLDSTTAIPGNLADAQLFQIKVLQTKQPGETGY